MTDPDQSVSQPDDEQPVADPIPDVPVEGVRPNQDPDDIELEEPPAAGRWGPTADYGEDGPLERL